MSRYQRYFIGVIALAIVAGLIVMKMKLIKGLDIDGGIRVVMQADPKNPADWPKDREGRLEKMASIRKTIQNRVKGLQGVSEALVVVQGDNRIVVELPGVKDPEDALRTIKSTAALEFYWLKDVQTANNPMGKWRMEPGNAEGKSYTFAGPRGETLDSENDADAKLVLSQVVDTEHNKPILTGKDLLPNAKPDLNPQGRTVVNIEFNKEGAKVFRHFTARHVGDVLAIFFDGKLRTAPEINEAIPSGRAEITGFRNLAEAKQMAEYLNGGALPVPLKVIAKDSVEPTLGKETVTQVVFAGIIGLALVVLFMLVYYRLPGAIADIALCLYALFVIAVFMVIKATMSLAGVAALIISIGMAVDANILIFERLKEELRSGKTLRAAIDAGFNRAFTAIFDSNVCTAITCSVLMAMGTPSVQSFALTLLIGVAISMFTAITVTRTILHLLVGWEWAQDPKWYGLGRNWLADSGLNIVGKRNVYFIISACLILPGLFFLGTSGLKRGIEFKSGTSIQATFKQPIELMPVREIVGKYSEANEVQIGKDKEGRRTVAFIKTLPLNDTAESGLRNDLNSTFGLATVNKSGQPAFDSISRVEPTVSKELTSNAILSVILASIAIVAYLSIRFAIGGIWAGVKFGTCAVIALIHDACFILGLFAILGKFFDWEIDSLFVTAVLTVIGFSVHDTIVVFDRIRENLRHRLRGESFEQLCNRSILQTFTRSINTSMTVVVTLGCLIAFGGPLLRHFYVALLVGIVIGTYSSIFNATPLVVVWENLAAKTAEPKKKAFEDKPLVPRATTPTIEPPVDKAVAPAESVTGTESDAGTDAEKSARIKRKTTKKKRF